MPRGVKTSLRLSQVRDEKHFQLWLEDNKITLLGEYVILFSVSSLQLPSTYLKCFLFCYNKKESHKNELKK